MTATEADSLEHSLQELRGQGRYEQAMAAAAVLDFRFSDAQAPAW